MTDVVEKPFDQNVFATTLVIEAISFTNLPAALRTQPWWSGQGMGRDARIRPGVPRCPLSKKALPKFFYYIKICVPHRFKIENENIKQFRLKFKKINIKKF